MPSARRHAPAPALLLVALICGCTLLPVGQTPEPSTAPPTLSPPTTAPTAALTHSPTQHIESSPSLDPTQVPTSSLVPEPSPDVSPTFWSGELRWRQLDGDRGLGEVLWVQDLVAGPGAVVAFGELGRSEWVEEWVFWSSTDGVDWERSFPPGGREWGAFIYGLTAVEDQFVAFGDRPAPGTGETQNAVFTAVDGRRWQYADGDLGLLEPVQIARSEDTIVTLGFEGDLMVSTNGGESWASSGSLDLVDQARFIVFDGQQFVVLTQASAENRHRHAGPMSAWRSSDGVDWMSLGEVLGDADEWPVIDVAAADGLIAVMLADPEGGIYSNGRRVWYKANDGTWQLAAQGPRGASRLFATSAGFLAVGQCVWDGEVGEFEGLDDYGVTWTSADGANWSYVPGAEHGKLIQAVAEYQGRLVGLGFDFGRYMANKPAGAAWTADLPAPNNRWADSGLDAPGDVCPHR